MATGYTITPELKKQFAASMAGHLDGLEKALLLLEKNPGHDTAVHSAFRAIHSIKGESDYIGIKDIIALTHELETLMDEVRTGKLQIEDKILPLLFEGLDILREMNRHVEDEVYPEQDLSSILEDIAKAVSASGKTEARVKKRPEVNLAAVFARSASQHMEYLRQTAESIVQGGSSVNAGEKILRSLNTLHTSANYAGFTRIAARVKEMKDRVEKVSSVRKNLASWLLAQVSAVEKALSETEAKPREKKAAIEYARMLDVLGEEIPVPAEKLDSFLTRTSELSIAKNALNNLMHRAASARVDAKWLNELKKVAAGIDKVSDEFEHEVMNLRLVRINSLFNRLPRLVRDLSRQAGKKVELIITGGETEIDRKVIEHLVDPLIHMIRNAVDHGIEPPSERIAKDKPEKGTITVNACQEGSRAVIQVIDDGRGIHADEIGRKALEKDIVSPRSLEAMSEEEKINLVFAPGFSTAGKPTSVSGRGVGLDIVKNNIGDMGGSVKLSTEPGVATRITLHVPLSMAVQEVLMAEVSGATYAFPFASILETLKVAREKIRVINKEEAVSYYETVLVLKYLDEILGIPPGNQLRKKGPAGDLDVIVLALGSQVIGIVVDRIISREGVLTKPLDDPLAGIKEYSGAALLGDGSIVLVLDPTGMF